MQRVVRIAVTLGLIVGASCARERIAPGGPRSGAAGFERVTVRNDSPSEICGMTACFRAAYHVGPTPNVVVSPERPIRPGETVTLDVPSCGDVPQADRCDHRGAYLVERDAGDAGILRIVAAP